MGRGRRRAHHCNLKDATFQQQVGRGGGSSGCHPRRSLGGSGSRSDGRGRAACIRCLSRDVFQTFSPRFADHEHPATGAWPAERVMRRPANAPIGCSAPLRHLQSLPIMNLPILAIAYLTSGFGVPGSRGLIASGRLLLRRGRTPGRGRPSEIGPTSSRQRAAVTGDGSARRRRSRRTGGRRWLQPVASFTDDALPARRGGGSHPRGEGMRCLRTSEPARASRGRTSR
jgi:hypothetical protein